MFQMYRQYVDRLSPTELQRKYIELLREYLVQVSPQRLAAYRRYREESFEYLTVRKLEAWHWEALYAMVTLETMQESARQVVGGRLYR